MRAYFFGNMYLSSIQQGIQAAHVTHELFTKYTTVSEDYELNSDPARIILFNWARHHKTMILLNAGYGENIHNLVQMFSDETNPYPWTQFHEEQASLDGAITSIGIVLPEKIYQMAAAIRQYRAPRNAPTLADRIMMDGQILVTPDDDINYPTEEPVTLQYSKFEYDLMLELNKYGLAS